VLPVGPGRWSNGQSAVAARYKVNSIIAMLYEREVLPSNERGSHQNVMKPIARGEDLYAAYSSVFLRPSACDSGTG